MTKYFVWIKNSHGVPEAQIWFGKQTDGNGKVKEVLAIHEIPVLLVNPSIRALEEIYPYEAKE